MALKQTMEAYDLLDAAAVSGADVAEILQVRGVDVEVRRLVDESGKTDLVRSVIPGMQGKLAGGTAPTTGIIGQLGGIGARPARIGLVSDADGAVTAIGVVLKLADMRRAGDQLPGDVVVTTHICPTAPTVARYPVEFMTSPVPLPRLVRHLVDPAMDGVVSVDATRGNRILNHRGLAITPTVKEGYILRVSEGLLDLVQAVTGRPAVVLPTTTQDITPYGNGVYHLNSLLQPATVTAAPVVGVAMTAETIVPGSATGVTRVVDLEEAVRLCIEVAKEHGSGRLRLHDPEELARLVELYGPMSHLQASQPWLANAWEEETQRR